MKNLAFSIVVIVLIVAGVVWIAKSRISAPGQNTGNVSGAGGKLFIEHSSFDFGSISMANGNVKHLFKIKNTGRESVMIKSMVTSCMCTTAFLIKSGEKFGPFGMPGHFSAPLLNKSIAPGEEADVEVVFDPAAHGPAGVGKIERVVNLEESSGKSYQFAFSALVTP